ncbi:MAG: peptidylprolyl isomerase [Steroidobacteraceae bacterium]
MLRPILASLALSMAGAAFAAETAAPAPAAASAPEPVLEQKSGVLLDRVVAVINDGVVTESELIEQIAVNAQRLREQKTALPPDSQLRALSLERLVLQELQLQRAERIGLKLTDEQLNSALAENVAQPNKLTLSELPAAMAAQGVDYALYRDNYRKQMTLARLRQREVESQIGVTPRELEQFIEKIKRSPDPETEYNTSHITLAIPPDATQAQVDELTKRALEIRERTKTEDFSNLAVVNSNTQDALEGGKLGWLEGPRLPSIFQEAVTGLKPGEVSQPLVDANGVHLLRLNEKRSSRGDPIEDQVHVRHILMKPNELQDDGTVRLKLSGIRDRVLKGEDFSVFASSMSEDTGSSVSGGDLDWKAPEEFVPEFAAVISSLSDNQISEPFQTRFGWHIVQLLGRRKFDITEDSLRKRAYEQLKESRLDVETELWLRRLRDEAFVDTSM